MVFQSVEGVQQWAFKAAASALEVIPRTLAQNCGANVVRVLTQLRVRAVLVVVLGILCVRSLPCVFYVSQLFARCVPPVEMRFVCCRASSARFYCSEGEGRF